MAIVESKWAAVPPTLCLPDDEIHLWRAALDHPAIHVERVAAVLSVDERNRAERFYFDQDRRRFIVGRGLLRMILGRYMSVEPRRLEFCYGPHGKPALVETAGTWSPRFNVSHSDGLALYAVTHRQELGVDVERIRPIADVGAIADRFFSAEENAVLHAVPPSRKIEAFFTCWTRKEAYIKATGDGLSLPLDQFDVSLAPGASSALLSIRGAPGAATGWLLRDLALGPEYVAALAVEGHGWHFQYWQWADGVTR